MKILLNTNKYVILLLSFLLLYGSGLAIATFDGNGYDYSFGGLQQDIFILRFGFAVLFAPLVETLVVQHWVIRTACIYLPFRSDCQKRAAAIVVSALVFSLLHAYSPFIMIAAFLAGLLLAFIYSLFVTRGDMNPVLAVFLVHFSNNLMNFILDAGEYFI